jgi:hypothetical protein
MLRSRCARHVTGGAETLSNPHVQHDKQTKANFDDVYDLPIHPHVPPSGASGTPASGSSSCEGSPQRA